MDAKTLTLIKTKVISEITKSHIRDEVLKVISVIEESRAPSVLNVTQAVLDKSGTNSNNSGLRYEKLSKEDLSELFWKIYNVSKTGDNCVEQLVEYMEALLSKQWADEQ